MTSNKKNLKSIEPNSGSVTFGDGKKRKIIGNGTLNVPRLHHLDDMLLVQGLHANLLA